MLIRSLSGRLLLLTLVFVMVAEVLIFVPSVARYRESLLTERLERAQIAALALLAAPDDMITPDLAEELLETAEVRNIVLRRNDVRELILAAPAPPPVDETFDLRDAGAAELILDALRVLAGSADRAIRVIGEPVVGGGVAIEVVLDEAPLRAAMRRYGLRILGLGLVISVIASALIAISVRRFLVRPMERVIDSMRRFAEAPEDPAGDIAPRSGLAEIAEAERALARLQNDLRAALRQRARLAALGEALAKVSHDLRNLLSTAQLLADSLEASADPRVARVGPKIIRSLDRAAALCASTLSYGRAEEPAPVLRTVVLSPLVDEVGDVVFPVRLSADEPAPGGVRFENATPPDLQIVADPEHLLRILVNLARNARQAMEGAGRAGAVRVSAGAARGWATIEVSDAGPGLPERAKENLFTPFKGGARAGGAGLGLAIASELARAHGGEVTLTRSTTEGAAFALRLPLRPATPESGAAARPGGASRP